MKFEEHCLESEMAFVERFEEVHTWLDAFAGTPGVGMRHRKFRHHKKGIEQVRVMYGDKAALAAKLHIISDLMEEGWKNGDPFPVDEDDYDRIGFY